MSLLVDELMGGLLANLVNPDRMGGYYKDNELTATAFDELIG